MSFRKFSISKENPEDFFVLGIERQNASALTKHEEDLGDEDDAELDEEDYEDNECFDILPCPMSPGQRLRSPRRSTSSGSGSSPKYTQTITKRKSFSSLYQDYEVWDYVS